jgi:NAD(P)-dependent dehydrogenase (short-subunit alcohol dehydrogenase family)
MNGSREPELAGQTVVVLGGSSGMGFETAKRARSEGADVVLSGRNPERVERAARELGALSSAAFDATELQTSQELLRRTAEAG